MNISNYLQSFGIRPSLHRSEVMKYLYENRTHPTAETIYAALSPTIPTLSKTTVYNILNLLSEKGAIQSLTIDPRQCHYDGDTSSHAHFFCTECGELYDIFIEPFKIECEHEVTHSQLYIKGICKHCKTK